MSKLSTVAHESCAGSQTDGRSIVAPIVPAGRRLRRPGRSDYRQTVIDEITRQVESRLRGDVHEFAIVITDDDRYRLEGWCARYHVKQMAQHLAMHLVSEGKLINDIQVRTVR